MAGIKGKSGRRKGKFVEEGDKLVRVNVILTENQIVFLDSRGNRSESLRELVEGLRRAPLDRAREDLEIRLRANQIEGAALRDQLKKLSSAEEMARRLEVQKEKDTPTRMLIINRIETMINRKFLGAHLADRLFDAAIVERASNVRELEEEWVKPILPFVAKLILDDVKVALDNASLDWPKTYTRDEAVRYALVDVCKFPRSVLDPMSEEEKLDLIKMSTLKRFPMVDNGTRKEVISRLDMLLKAYSLNRSATDLIEDFYPQKSAEMGVAENES